MERFMKSRFWRLAEAASRGCCRCRCRRFFLFALLLRTSRGRDAAQEFFLRESTNAHMSTNVEDLSQKSKSENSRRRRRRN